MLAAVPRHLLLAAALGRRVGDGDRIGERAHTGHLAALPDGAGTAFVPDQPFTDGEQVSVTAHAHLAERRHGVGRPGRHDDPLLVHGRRAAELDGRSAARGAGSARELAGRTVQRDEPPRPNTFTRPPGFTPRP